MYTAVPANQWMAAMYHAAFWHSTHVWKPSWVDSNTSQHVLIFFIFQNEKHIIWIMQEIENWKKKAVYQCICFCTMWVAVKTTGLRREKQWHLQQLVLFCNVFLETEECQSCCLTRMVILLVMGVFTSHLVDVNVRDRQLWTCCLPTFYFKIP